MPTVPDTIVLIDENHAAARVVDRIEGHETDLYFYSTLEGGWRVSAMRTMSRTGILAQIVADAEAAAELPKVLRRSSPMPDLLSSQTPN